MPLDAGEPALFSARSAAEVLDKKVGDVGQIEATELAVARIVSGGALVEDGSVVFSSHSFRESGNRANSTS